MKAGILNSRGRSFAQSSKQQQKGVYAVEFAVSAGVFFFFLFASLEVARAMYTWSALDAVTQRGARVAAVCPLNHPSVSQVAIFGSGGSSTVIPGIDTSHVQVRYLNNAGAPTAVRSNVSYVEVSIQNYTHQTFIPATVSGFLTPVLTPPPFTTVRPAESLGINPGAGDFC